MKTRSQHVRVLSAWNTLIIVLLGGVLELQVREVVGETSIDHMILFLHHLFFFGYRM